jgi:Na+-driven multidrug efflux pump
MPSRTIKASKGLITDLMQYFVLILLQILLAPIILKVSGQEVLGAYSIVMQVIGYGLILDLGLGVALNRYLAQTYQGSESNNYNFLEIFNIGRIFILLTNLLLAAFIIIFAFNIDNLITASNVIILDTQKSLFIFSIWIIFRTPLVLYGNALIASQNMATANIIGLISGSSRLFLSIGLVYF